MAPLLDYTSMPYKLKPEAKLWCIVLRGIEYTSNMSEVDDNIKLLVHKDYLNTKFPTHKIEYLGDFNKLIATEYYDDVETLREVIFESDLSQRLYEREKDTLIKSEMEEIEYNIWYNEFEGKQVITKDNLRDALRDTEVLIGHNIVNYDLPMLMLFNVLEYTIGFPGKPHTLFGRKIKIIDTLILSKIFNPDRMDTYGRHALSAWGKRAGDYKLAFDRFDIFTAHLCFYCAQDTKSNEGALNLLELEKMEDDWGDKWNDAIDLETKLIDLTLRQELVGFELDVELCHKNLKELEGLLQEREDIIVPSLPPKPMGVTESKSYIPPKIQFKKDGSLSAVIIKFAEKHGATILEIPSKDDPDSKEYFFTYKDQSFKLPFEDQIETHTEAAVKDNEHIKIYLLSLGWEPTEWSERDLTKDSQKKSLTADKVVQTIVRYADKTFNSGLRDHRLKMLELPLSMSQEDFVELYVDRYQENPRKPLKVVTSPKIKVGAEKEIDPKLLEIEDKKEFSIAFAEYTTYKHRKSSIAGGECFTGDTEVLTDRGFILFSGLLPTDKILQINKDFTSEFVIPNRFIKKEYEGPLVYNSTKKVKTLTTPNHLLVYLQGSNKKLYKEEAHKRVPSSYIPVSTLFNKGLGTMLSKDQIILTLAVCADSSIYTNKTKKSRVHIAFKKERKASRLRQSLVNLDINFFESFTKDCYYFFSFDLPSFIEGKQIPRSWLLDASIDEKIFILKELGHWDGYFIKDREAIEFSSKTKEECLYIQSLAHTTGLYASLSSRFHKKFKVWGYRVRIAFNTVNATTQRRESSDILYKGLVYCVTVPSGMILTRYKDSISIVGNCDEETGEPTKGYLSNYRPEDNRIPTPADTIGCATSRYQHRVVERSI